MVGQPTPKVMWMKDGKEIKPDAQHKIESSEETGVQKLTVVKSTKLDSGEYTCKAISTAGEAKTVGQVEVKGINFIFNVLTLIIIKFDFSGGTENAQRRSGSRIYENLANVHGERRRNRGS